MVTPSRLLLPGCRRCAAHDTCFRAEFTGPTCRSSLGQAGSRTPDPGGCDAGRLCDLQACPCPGAPVRKLVRDRQGFCRLSTLSLAAAALEGAKYRNS